jgi:sugar phosphate isomerase/epimerase
MLREVYDPVRLGIFAKTFERPTVQATLEAVAGVGLRAAQFNLSIAGLGTLPGAVPTQTIETVRVAALTTGVELVALSGTFNGAHPDPAVRKAYLERFPVLCGVAEILQIPLITLSSGTRNPNDMWEWDADNASASAWRDSAESLAVLAATAAHHGLTVAVEPEWTNVVSSAQLARKMLDQLAAPNLGIVFDAANIIDPEKATDEVVRATIEEALDLLGADIVLVHAKELVRGRELVPAGAGLIPWEVVAGGLRSVGFKGAIVIHGLPEASVPSAVGTLTKALEEAR